MPLAARHVAVRALNGVPPAAIGPSSRLLSGDALEVLAPWPAASDRFPLFRTWADIRGHRRGGERTCRRTFAADCRLSSASRPLDGGPGHTGLAGDALHRQPGIPELSQLAECHLDDGLARPLVSRPPQAHGTSGERRRQPRYSRCHHLKRRGYLIRGVAGHEVGLTDEGVGAERAHGRHDHPDDHEVVECAGEAHSVGAE